MKYRFTFKIITIIALMIGLLAVKSFISGLVYERTSWRQQAYHAIEQSWPGEQTFAGPVLSVPYKRTFYRTETVYNNKKEPKDIVKEDYVRGSLLLIPKQLAMHSDLNNNLRHRGIYEIPVFTSHVKISGEFSNQELVALVAKFPDSKFTWEQPTLSVLVKDQRGIASQPLLTWQGATINFQPSSHLQSWEQGMNAQLPVLPSIALTRIPFAFELQLHGMRAMNFAMLAENTDVIAKANWPHPSFTGQLLPEGHDIDAQGFSARWRASAFSLNIAKALERCQDGYCADLLQATVGFDLIQPVDIYQQSERSIKYAVLFIVLTFVALILLELLKKLRIHPIQYSLVGMALLVFYLLLISLSEHIAFLYAYLAGASACTLVLMVYFGGILRSGLLGLLLGAGLSILYAVLYVILQSENNALLMGSVLTFVVLAALMLATRHFDWYALTRQNNHDGQLDLAK